jgi:hypothetical protein
LQSASSVEKRIALSLPFFKIEEDLSVPIWSSSFAMTWIEEVASYLAELYDGEIIQM